MIGASPEHELKMNFIKGYIKRIDDIVTEQGVHTTPLGGPRRERFLPFKLTHYLHETSVLILPGEHREESEVILFRAYPQGHGSVRPMLKKTVGKHLPRDIPYWGIQIMEPEELGGHRASTRYMFNQRGDGVVMHYSNREGVKLNPPYETEDLTGGDHEYIEWILKSIEKML